MTHDTKAASDYVTQLGDGRTMIVCGHEAAGILILIDTDRIRLTEEQWEAMRSRLFDHGWGSAR